MKSMFSLEQLLLDAALSPFSELHGVEATIARDMLTDCFRVRLTWLVSSAQLADSRHGDAASVFLATFEAISAADDRALIESGTTSIVLGED